MSNYQPETVTIDELIAQAPTQAAKEQCVRSYGQAQYDLIMQDARKRFDAKIGEIMSDAAREFYATGADSEMIEHSLLELGRGMAKDRDEMLAELERDREQFIAGLQ